MTDRTPASTKPVKALLVVFATVAALGIAACGDSGSVPGMDEGSGLASQEPIDAVPLPLDDNPMAPTPVVGAAKEAEAKTSEPDPTATTTTDSDSSPMPETAGAAPAPPQIVVAPREPARPVDRPPTTTPATPEQTPEKPVLNF